MCDINVYADVCVCDRERNRTKIEQEYTEHKIQREQYKRQQQQTINKWEEEECRKIANRKIDFISPLLLLTTRIKQIWYIGEYIKAYGAREILN